MKALSFLDYHASSWVNTILRSGLYRLVVEKGDEGTSVVTITEQLRGIEKKGTQE